jgi:hypothetical protein
LIYGMHEKSLDQPHASIMTLAPGPGIRPFYFLFATILGTVGGVKFSEALAAPNSDSSRFWFPCLILVAAFCGVVAFFSGTRDDFDRARKQWTRRCWWTRRSRDLADIIRVQVTFGGYHSDSSEGGGTYTTRRLSLIFKDPAEKPFLLAEESDDRWTRETAAILAAFLEVPLNDEPEMKILPWVP